MIYSKIPLKHEELLDLLKMRGLIIEDNAFALDCLRNIGYYRLSGYWFKYQNKYVDDTLAEQESFIKDVSLTDIVSIYRFDTKLRSLVFDAIEKIEISFSARLNDIMSLNYNSDWYLNASLFKDTNKHQELTKEIFQWITRNNDKLPIKSFKNKHPNEDLPFWIVALVIPFGTLSKLYGLLQEKYQKLISAEYQMTARFMVSALRLLTVVRNNCAHYNRLFDFCSKVQALQIQNPTKLSKYNYTFSCKNNDFFYTFYLISLFLILITPKSRFCVLVKDLINRYTMNTRNKISFTKLGFPENWENILLFVKMLNN